MCERSSSSCACRLHCCWTEHPDWLIWYMRASVIISSMSCTAEPSCSGSMVPVQKEKEPDRGRKGFFVFLIEKYFITNKTATVQLYLFILSTQIYPNRSFAHTAIKCPSCSSSCVLQVIILVFQVSQFPFRKNIWRSKTKTGLWPVSCCHGNIYRAYWQYRSFQNVLFTWWSAHLSRITIRKNYVDVKQNILHIRGRSLIQFI